MWPFIVLAAGAAALFAVDRHLSQSGEEGTESEAQPEPRVSPHVGRGVMVVRIFLRASGIERTFASLRTLQRDAVPYVNRILRAARTAMPELHLGGARIHVGEWEGHGFEVVLRIPANDGDWEAFAREVAPIVRADRSIGPRFERVRVGREIQG